MPRFSSDILEPGRQERRRIPGVGLAINANSADHSLPTSPGLTQSLQCTVQNHMQDEQVRWFREGRQVSLKDGNQVNASSICVSPVTVEDDGVSFTCKLARNDSVQVSVTLDVKFAPILSGEDPPPAAEESDVTLSCHVKANPPAQMSWWKNDSTLTLEKSRYQILQTAEVLQLKIQSVQKSDAGTYTCVAQSTDGEAKRSFHLVVEDKKIPFPTEAVITAAVVVFLTILFAVVARREKIFKCFKKAKASPTNTAL
nr:transmembrane and immunoglobulin domain-containing protein 1 [Pogona vitticeps]